MKTRKSRSKKAVTAQTVLVALVQELRKAADESIAGKAHAAMLNEGANALESQSHSPVSSRMTIEMIGTMAWAYKTRAESFWKDARAQSTAGRRASKKGSQ